MEDKVVIISGFAGSGKSTLAKAVSEEFGLKYVSASNTIKDMKDESENREKTQNPDDLKDWWETEEGMNFVAQREKDMSFDKKLDRFLLERIDEGDVVVDCKTMGNLSKKGFKIWLKANSEVRASRVGRRDSFNVSEVLGKLNERDKADIGIYEKLYNFKLGEDFDNFDLVLDTNGLNKEEVRDKVFREVRRYLESFK
jgi:cytidylate kinase